MLFGSRVIGARLQSLSLLQLGCREFHYMAAVAKWMQPNYKREKYERKPLELLTGKICYGGGQLIHIFCAL